MESGNPYLTGIAKKIRNLKKKVEKLEKAEKQREEGAVLNEEQVSF
jgi:hypothetical protein